MINVPLADTINYFPVHTVNAEHQQSNRDKKANIPQPARLHFNWPADIFGNIVVSLVAVDQWFSKLGFVL
jgi:hypothetical protein